MLICVPGLWEQHVRLAFPSIPEGREIAVPQIISMQVAHLQEHIDQIRAVRRAQGI